MAIIGIRKLRYGVEDLGACTRFFTDFGLLPLALEPARAIFSLANGSIVELLALDDPAVQGHEMVGAGVKEVTWGVDTMACLSILRAGLASDHAIEDGIDGAFRIRTPVGVLMSFEQWRPTAFATAPDPINAPGVINRLNTHRKWRRVARPKVINHVVFQVTEFEVAALYMRERLGFRLTDVQQGFGCYLRADGSNHHHNILFLNARAPIPGCDGEARFDHANFGMEDIDELMIGVNNMVRQGWEESRIGLGRHRIDSALFYYFPCPAGGEAEYGADADFLDDSWVPRYFTTPLFAYAHFTHHIPEFLRVPPPWDFRYLTEAEVQAGRPLSVD